ncbi:MAG TPA: response regulator [Gemmatimonadales bacterium]|nr:response regulator [Gemmatimonadales bacterium]
MERSQPEAPPVVLVVGPDDAVHADICRMVRAIGFRVRTAHGGCEAIRYLQLHPGEVGLVLADILMPGMDGGELVERVRDLLPGMRCVLMSPPAAAAAELAGAYPETPVLEKPFGLRELHGVLARQIGSPAAAARSRTARPARPAFHRSRAPRS